MTFELQFVDPSDRPSILQPSIADLGEAYLVVQRHVGGIADLRNLDTRAVLQILSFGDDCDVCVAVFPRDEDAVGALYSESAVMDAADVIAVCEAFMSPEGISGCTILFDAVEWWERKSKPTAQLAMLPVSTEDEEPWIPDSSQEVIDAFLGDSAYSDDIDALRSALADGGRFEAFTPLPPLVYAALHCRNVEPIAMLVELGEDIGALHEGQTAFWHAVTKSRFAFADALLAHGAHVEEARTSPNYRRWQRRDEERRILDAIEAGDERAVEEYLKGRPRNDASHHLCTEAIVSGRLAILNRLLSHRGALNATSSRRGAAWTVAMRQSDTRYLQALVDHGMYNSVEAKPEDLRSFSYASPEAIAYLCSAGLLAGLADGFRFLVNRSSPRKRALIAAFPDSFFVGLDPQQLTNAILSFEQCAPDRTDGLLDCHDFGPLVHYLFNEAYCEVAYEVIPRIFGVAVAGPSLNHGSWLAAKYVAELRGELALLLRSLLGVAEYRCVGKGVIPPSV